MMQTVLVSVILSALVAYGVSKKVARNADIDLSSYVNEKISDLEDNDSYRAEQYADLNARCYYSLGRLDDIEHMVVNNSRETQQIKKDNELIIRILQRMKEKK